MARNGKIITAGKSTPFFTAYREIAPPEWLIYTFEFEVMLDHIILETVTFEEQDGKTKQIVIDLSRQMKKVKGCTSKE